MTADIQKLSKGQGLFSGANCVDSTRIRSFLSLSRIADDTFKTHMTDCQYFTDKVLPEWHMRAKLIEYCGDYAKSIRQEVVVDDKSFDLTNDPYALRDYQDKLKEKNAVADSVDTWVHNETAVESIVREGTLKVMKERCWDV